MSKQNFRVCFCFRRRFKLRAVEPPDDVRRLFESYSDNGTMSANYLRSFLMEFQEEDNATDERVQEIFNSLKHLNIFQRKGLHLEAFFRYLIGDHNLAISPSLGVHHDMNAPLAHYYMYTGHNSYLTGNQISSDCSIDPIIKALKKGVRVIELDLWANSTRDDVDVKHGGTLTTPVQLIKCLRAIKEYAFYASEYPVVVTFEDHLNSDLQAKVARMVTRTFGDMLFYPESDLKEFPSPEFLKKKILISTKPPKEFLEFQSMEVKGNPQKVKASTEEEPWENENLAVGNELKTDDTGNDESSGEDEDVQDAAPEYRRLIAIHAGKLKTEIRGSLSTEPNKVGRLSLSEQELENAARTYGPHIVRRIGLIIPKEIIERLLEDVLYGHKQSQFRKDNNREAMVENEKMHQLCNSRKNSLDATILKGKFHSDEQKRLFGADNTKKGFYSHEVEDKANRVDGEMGNTKHFEAQGVRPSQGGLRSSFILNPTSAFDGLKRSGPVIIKEAGKVGFGSEKA
ncbi:unnamed protein product [Ilex paraguariensis]|uniref:Phosphoinositide phospholipase C n=1 Tax=Ilex paraguariensis TaxID=185542 RepID=A0ABC8QWY7_9AQUA